MSSRTRSQTPAIAESDDPADERADSGDGEPQIARLVASQLKRMRRIVDAAVDLAEQGGFEAVRLRDVAE
ncbi:MAG: hypothetical protein GY725_07795, partial [bacterium]|nr:hypothetical protein [bacterium]